MEVKATFKQTRQGKAYASREQHQTMKNKMQYNFVHTNPEINKNYSPVLSCLVDPVQRFIRPRLLMFTNIVFTKVFDMIKAFYIDIKLKKNEQNSQSL